MNHTEPALHYFKTGFNCAQSVLTPFSEQFGLAEDHCLKVACAFGAGMGRQQQTCGAVTGALMVLGLHFGKGKMDDNARKIHTYEKTQEFMKAFTEKHGSINCLELLEGLHMSNPEESKEIDARELYRLKCTRYVSDAVQIAAKLIGESKDLI
jgi:C_GCAxxG_C_C family probable redox protein